MDDTHRSFVKHRFDPCWFVRHYTWRWSPHHFLVSRRDNVIVNLSTDALILVQTKLINIHFNKHSVNWNKHSFEWAHTRSGPSTNTRLGVTHMAGTSSPWQTARMQLCYRGESGWPSWIVWPLRHRFRAGTRPASICGQAWQSRVYIQLHRSCWHSISETQRQSWYKLQRLLTTYTDNITKSTRLQNNFYEIVHQ